MLSALLLIVACARIINRRKGEKEHGETLDRIIVEHVILM